MEPSDRPVDSLTDASTEVPATDDGELENLPAQEFARLLPGSSGTAASEGASSSVQISRKRRHEDHRESSSNDHDNNDKNTPCGGGGSKKNTSAVYLKVLKERSVAKVKEATADNTVPLQEAAGENFEVLDYLDFEEEREISQIRLHGTPDEGRLRELFHLEGRFCELPLPKIPSRLYDPATRRISAEGLLALEESGQVTSLLSEFVCSLVLQPMPSLGSLRHFKGDCRPCCFFRRQRCVSGTRCLHCHYPHEKVPGPGKKMRARIMRRQAEAARGGGGNNNTGETAAAAAAAAGVSCPRSGEERCEGVRCAGERGPRTGVAEQQWSKQQSRRTPAAAAADAAAAPAAAA